MAVIDLLEAIEVEIGHCERAPAALTLQHGVLQSVGQQRAVGQVGEQVVMRDALELLLLRLERGDVGDDRVAAEPVVGQGGLDAHDAWRFMVAGQA